MEGTKQGLCPWRLQAGPAQPNLTLCSHLHLGCLSPINRSFGHPCSGRFWLLCQGLDQNPEEIPLLQHFSQCDVFGGGGFGQQMCCTGMSTSVPTALSWFWDVFNGRDMEQEGGGILSHPVSLRYISCIPCGDPTSTQTRFSCSWDGEIPPAVSLFGLSFITLFKPEVPPVAGCLSLLCLYLEISHFLPFL